MYIRNSTHAIITRWEEYRTPSGRWSKVKHNEEVVQADAGAAYLRKFFAIRMRGERWEFAYFEQGYLPCRITSPSPDGTMRYVYILEYSTA